jgi:hypothetical protein
MVKKKRGTLVRKEKRRRNPVGARGNSFAVPVDEDSTGDDEETFAQIAERKKAASITANSPGQKSPDKKKARTRNSSNAGARTPDSPGSSTSSKDPVFATINSVTAPPAKPHLVSVYKLKRAFNC